MTVKIIKPIQGGSIKSIASKSEAHRMLICAALANTQSDTLIECIERSEDINATVRCLNALGASISHENGIFSVKPIIRETEQKPIHVLDCGESGSTLRFLLPVAAALGLSVSFILKGRLPERPLKPLLDEMSAHGCSFSMTSPSELNCHGKLSSGIYRIPGDVSSQFISGLLFALPLIQGDSKIIAEGKLESGPYVDITLGTLKAYGIKITEDEKQVFSVTGGQDYITPGKITVSGDWSNAAFWLTSGAMLKNSSLSGAVSVTGLNLDSLQGDRAITEILSAFGADIAFNGDSVTVKHGKLKGTKINAENIPDLVPVIAALASIAEGETIIYNAGRLRIKESDRLHTVTEALTSLGADIVEKDDILIIKGKESLKGGAAKSYGDHRIAMTLAILSSVCKEPVMIEDKEAVNKSYPAFFEDFKLLGGEVEYI